MPGGRRTAKSSSFKHHPHVADDRHACELPTQPQVIPPKHIPVPELPTASDLNFEFEAFTFCLFAMSCQYINLYRTVFWLPYSHTDHALNYYLIDYYVVTINLIMVGRRLPVCALKQICFSYLPTSYHSTSTVCVRIVTIVVLVPVLIFCIYYVIIQHGILSIIFICYPLVVYLIAFGPTTIKFFELRTVIPERNTGARSKNSVNSKNSSGVGHICSMSAEIVRDEVEVLKNDFNARLKQVLFNSLLVVYHTAFLPCYFAQSTLYYEINWVIQHAVFTGISCFTSYASHCFPTRYCDVLHRAALHLGRWQKVETKTIHVPYSTWSDSTVWNQGALVKHCKELFKAEGISNAAEPGHAAHSRFYALFKNPTNPVQCLLIVQIMLMLSQMVIAIQSYTWNNLISVQLLLFINCRTLHRIARVYLVVRKIYYEEGMLLSKFSN